MVLLWIAVGGAIGAVARYGLGAWIHARTGPGFPWGTFAVNLIGCLLIGFLLRYMDALVVSAETRAFVLVGLLSSFTTFSTYSYETVALLREGHLRQASLYSLGSLGLGVAAVYIGLTLAGQLLRARAGA